MTTTGVDPICGMPVDPATASSAQTEAGRYFFCSDYCRREFLRRPRERRDLQREERLVLQDPSSRRVAYLSMEIALLPGVPTYAGGLGVLAGDALRSCADLRLPVVGLTLLHRQGYFTQQLGPDGEQREAPATWSPEQHLQRLEPRAQVEVEGRRVQVALWQFLLHGATGYPVPVLLLDTDLPENAPEDRALTGTLYGGDARYRLAQEVVLGIGGIRALAALGYDRIEKLHLNEGHAALAALELLEAQAWQRSSEWDFEPVRRRCVFTTHTPVPAGHDQFDPALVRQVLRTPVPGELLRMLGGEDALNMTRLALNLSRYVNGVAHRHGEVTGQLFPGYRVHSITNGVHPGTWTCDSFRALYGRHLPGWEEDPALLRHALALPAEALRAAHAEAKGALLRLVQERSGRALRPELLTLGFARRSTAYKRGDLLLRDVERLRRLGRGRLQLVYAGKAHPHDEEGKALIRRIVAAGRQLGEDVPLVYLPDYDLAQARVLVAGVDVWLNTPLRPLEASGTSGMKAALNGVPSLSVLDGWWLEGCIEGLTGWAVGGAQVGSSAPEAVDAEDAEQLYRKLEQAVLPAFHGDAEGWTSLVRHAIALNGSYFTSHRMMAQYATHAYLAEG